MPELEQQNDQEFIHKVNIDDEYDHDIKSISKRLCTRKTNQNRHTSSDIQRKAFHDSDE